MQIIKILLLDEEADPSIIIKGLIEENYGKDSFSVVLVDVKMPNVNTLVEEIKKISDTPIAVIAENTIIQNAVAERHNEIAILTRIIDMAKDKIAEHEKLENR